MLNLETDRYYGLDAIGSRIWELLAHPTTAGEICVRLGSEYEVDADTCWRDVSVLLQELLDARLVHTLEG